MFHSLSFMKKYLYTFGWFFTFGALTHAQTGGLNVFSFLNHAPSARIAALGGSQIALRSEDLALGALNPALLNEQMHNALSFNYESFLAGVGDGYVGYGYHVSKWKTTFQGGVQFINYGTFKGTDEFGNPTPEFKAGEYALTIGAGYAINERLSVGVNAKYISSQLEMYRSTGIAGDIGGSYYDPESQFGAAIVLRNVGSQLSAYNNGVKGPTEADLQIGVSKKLTRAPLRFGIVLHDLNRWHLLYTNPLDNQVSLLGETSSAPSAFAQGLDNAFRHVILNGELVFGKRENFRVSFGYNHQLKKELSVNNVRGLSGFSFGLSVRVNRFRLEYGTGKYHIAGGGDYLSISTNLGEFKKKI